MPASGAFAAYALETPVSQSHDGSAAFEPVEDRALARRIRQGDESAFEELVSRHHAAIARIAGRFFRRREAAEDVVQETFLKAYLAIGAWRGEVPLERWLARIATNACYDQLRRRRGETAALAPVEDVEGLLDRLAAPFGSAAAAYWEREDARLLAEQILERLQPADRLVLTLTVLEELSVAEVAERTGWSKANVKIRAFRARARLRGILSRPGKER